MNPIEQLSKLLNISFKQVSKTVELLKEGGTVPFISRYRKEQTGGLDEVQILDIKNGLEKLQELEKRKQTVIKAIVEQGLMTEEVKNLILKASTITEVEDIYLPFKKKRKTKATVARDNGLEPLAKIIMAQSEEDVARVAARFVKGEVKTKEDALEGARFIIAEWINERVSVRNIVRNTFNKQAVAKAKVVKGKEISGEKFKDYFDYSEPTSKLKSHRTLALLRAENEGFIRLKIEPEQELVLDKLNEKLKHGWNESSEQVELAIKDSYKRLLKPSIETEHRNILKVKADEQAIAVFSENLKQLLMSAPVGQKRILALDPGFKSGCKLVCLDENGGLIHNENIYPHAPQKDTAMASKKVVSIVERYKIEVIAIGNGTASRETEYFIKRLKFDRKLQVFMVSEDGASIYSASKVAREEFPQFDVTVRGAVSIGRRLMDPLAELVKIDPKSVGVGQYQHDVNQTLLKNSLDDVVISCVNRVGVNVNTASKYLLKYVSGLGETTAQNILDYRKENGDFTSRTQLKKVKRMGEKAYEQSIAFLRISGAKNPLDNSAVHPESYYLVEKIAKSLKVKKEDLIGNDEVLNSLSLENFQDKKSGFETIKDIIQELKKPSRDPRQRAKVLEFSDKLRTIVDVIAGMELNGIVTNVTNFGCFVDIGIKENGLVHISNICDEYISSPAEKVKLHQHVKVKVLEVDAQRKRIGLTMNF
ncbi:RNA-binding transcriptional accessory protein [Flavobacteriales bacterium]|nr:RNA-binding transcriptional accessory protein [Flavobacteriales bacterium]